MCCFSKWVLKWISHMVKKFKIIFSVLFFKTGRNNWKYNSVVCLWCCQITEVDMNNGGNLRQIPLKGIINLVALAVDWIGNNIYVVDQTGRKIDVVNIDSGLQRNLLGFLMRPSAVAVDPNEGYSNLSYIWGMVHWLENKILACLCIRFWKLKCSSSDINVYAQPVEPELYPLAS